MSARGANKSASESLSKCLLLRSLRAYDHLERFVGSCVVGMGERRWTRCSGQRRQPADSN